jgi:hypothetical protein
LVVLWSEDTVLVFTDAIPVKTVFKSEGVRNLKLFPGDDPCSSDFVRLHSESAIFVIEHVGFLSENSREEPDDGPAEEASVCGSVATIEEGILFLGVTV